jgi:nucleoid DNA-binding protein
VKIAAVQAEIDSMETIAAAAAKPQASKPFNKKDLVGALAEQHQLSKRASQEMLDDLIGMITKHLKKGERVKITGLGRPAVLSPLRIQRAVRAGKLVFLVRTTRAALLIR